MEAPRHTTLSDAQLDRLADLAAALTPLSAAAIIMGIDEAMLREAVADEDSPAHTAYHTAKELTMLDIRQTEIKLARAGSPLAMQLVGGYLNRMEAEE